jgi:DNA mismatch endonuclease (patch repair protein)
MVFEVVPNYIRKRMVQIRKTNTRPEMVVRRLVHRLGFRFRLYRRDMPGTPDLVLSRLRKVIFVHGCFWHQHDCRLGRKQPKSRPEYWLPKLARNVARDEASRIELQKLGWDVLVVWECETKMQALLEQKVRHFLFQEECNTDEAPQLH